jgi:hypothetical protein
MKLLAIFSAVLYLSVVSFGQAPSPTPAPSMNKAIDKAVEAGFAVREKTFSKPIPARSLPVIVHKGRSV